MEIKIYKNDSVPLDVYQIVSDLLHDAFAERLEQNIPFGCAKFSPMDVRSHANSGESCYILVAYDNNEAIATSELIIRKKFFFNYGSTENVAVSSVCKGKGIGTKLFQESINIAKKLGLGFITSVTAVNANSSVKAHTKAGFYIYRKCYGSAYNSYAFIYPIRCFKFVRINFIRIIMYHIFEILNKIK